MSWSYQGDAFIEAPEEYQGFVYIITELDTGKMYVGKKFFWKPKVLPVNKTKKRKIRTKSESDWKDYYGSSKEVQELVEQKGKDNYKREILHLCKTKGECSYMELHEQITRKVLLKQEYYNEFVGAKIHSKHVLNLHVV